MCDTTINEEIYKEMNEEKNNSPTRAEIEKSRRNKLKEEKPLVHEKIILFKDKFDRGESIAAIDITYDFRCNLRCQHCCNLSFEKKDRCLTPEKLRDISEQADALGLCQFVISGGEPLLFPDLEDVVKALQPDKFYISISTNGHFLTKEKAVWLKSIGVDRLKISIDSIDPKKHDDNRNNDGAYEKAMNALTYAKEAGLSVVMQSVFTKESTLSDDTEQLAKFGYENNYAIDVMLAKPIGEWEGNMDVLVSEEGLEYLEDLHKKYPVLFRDTMPSYGIERGCNTVNSVLSITKYGDVLPCIFIHIDIGNIFDESLENIINRGLAIKHYKEHTKKCLAGQDRNFIDNYMSKFFGKPLPISYKDAFTAEDYVDGVEYDKK